MKVRWLDAWMGRHQKAYGDWQYQGQTGARIKKFLKTKHR